METIGALICIITNFSNDNVGLLALNFISKLPKFRDKAREF